MGHWNHEDKKILANPIVLKIEGGTRITSKRLCDTCHLGMVRKDENARVEIICRSGPNDTYVHINVVECSSYSPKGVATLGDMEEIAWRLVTKKNSMAVGFVDPTEFERKYKAPDKDDK